LTILPDLTLSLPVVLYLSDSVLDYWPDPEPACGSVPFGLCSGLLTSAWPDPEPACHSVPFGLCSGFLTSARPDLSFTCPLFLL
jgi:hypothetical protein